MIILSPGFHHLPSRNIPVTEGLKVLPCDQSHLEAFRQIAKVSVPMMAIPSSLRLTAASGERSDGVTATSGKRLMEMGCRKQMKPLEMRDP